MFWKAWNPNQQAMPAAATRPKTSSARRAMASARQMHDHSRASARPAPSRPSSSPATVKTKSVCCSGTKPGAGLRAVEEALPEQPAVADRDPGLLDVVAGAAGVEVGVDEGQEPVHLVGLRASRRRRRRGSGDPAADAAGASHRRGAPETARTPNTVAESTSIVPRSGWSRISTAGTPAISQHQQARRANRPRRRQRPSARSASTSAMPMTTASFANSDGWMDRPSRPAARTASR